MPHPPTARPMTLETVALQLYTVREAMSNDPLGTLRQVAKMGYRAVEFAGFGGIPVADLRATLDDLGVHAMSAHIPFADFHGRLPAVLKDLQTLGCEHAVVPSVPEDRRSDAAAVSQLTASFNQFAATCRAEGISFAYHNHAFEFAPLAGDGAGRTFFDVLVADTDPALVGLELDLYWAAHAGVDPLALLRQHADRVPLIHLKDMAKDDRADVPVGDGTLPWPEILSAAAGAHVRWYIVEQDYPRDAMVDVERSLRYLSQKSEVRPELSGACRSGPGIKT